MQGFQFGQKIEVTEVYSGEIPEGCTAHQEVTMHGKSFRLERHDPYGLWIIVPLDDNELPDALNQKFTAAKIAYDTLELYLNNEVDKLAAEAKKLTAHNKKMDELKAAVDSKVAEINKKAKVSAEASSS